MLRGQGREVEEGEQGRRKPLVFAEIKAFQVASWAVISCTLPGFVSLCDRRR